MRRALRVWAAALGWLYPPGFRRTVGGDLARLLVDRGVDARRGGIPRMAGFLARNTAIGLRDAALEWHRAAAERWPTPGVGGGLRFSSLDVKLGVRMLLKYPGLSAVSVAGMAVAIAIAAAVFGGFESQLNPSLPLPAGERLVSLENLDVREGQPAKQALHDFLAWRTELRSVRDLSAFTTDSRNVTTAEAGTALVSVAQVTPSAFAAARVAPALGRELVEEDAREGAAPVVVIAYEEWQRRFGGDPGVLGREIRLGATAHTVVGVMPEGFGFPISHRYWVPLSLDPDAYPVGEGPSIDVFGRLADGATLTSAQAELDAIGARRAADHPETHRDLRPRVMPYVDAFGPGAGDIAFVRVIQVAVSLLLVLVAANVAVLVYARTATRTGEIAVRTALGASRRRVIAQLFTEGLVLAVVSAAVGLTIAGLGLNAVEAKWRARDDVPFWFELGLPPEVVAYVAALVVLAGVIVGVVPALKATGRRTGDALQQLASRGAQMQLGRTWTALIVLQVAVAVTVLPFALRISGEAIRGALAPPGYTTGEVLEAVLSVEQEEGPPSAQAEAHRAALQARFLADTRELLRRLEAEPEVAGATLARPGGSALVEGEGGATSTSIGLSRIAPEHFDVLGAPITAGRGFTAADTVQGATAAIVDRVFLERVMGGGQGVGRRVRLLTRSQDSAPGELDRGPWLEIVGVVPDLYPNLSLGPPTPNLYVAAPSTWEAESYALRVRVRGAAPEAYARRLREIAAEVDPGLLLQEVKSAAAADGEDRRSALEVAGAIAIVTASVLLLSSAGIYAMMSFTVARRRREIGIRSALGARPRRLLAGVFGRAGAQLGAGVLAGLTGAALASRAIDAAGGLGDAALAQGPLAEGGWILVPAVAALMLALGMLAALGPARRGLAIEPTEALREEG